ncbi:hypothetical protein [Kangiella shandongensis]|uniref:hypothetical protein n=1 Tax=Kangiella shandongensis TaxID=2763258 RepID=UPI001CBEC5B1|nr:hypothetical protein [Kangiella shandongensis]
MQTKLSRNTRFDQPKRIEHKLQTINDNYLQVRSFAGDAHAIYGFAGWFGFLLIFLPLDIYILIDLSKETLESFGKGTGITEHIRFGLLLMSAIIVFGIAMGPGFSYWNAWMLKRESPIIFDRKNQVVRKVVSGLVFESPWNNIKGRIKNMTTLSGAVVMNDAIIELDLKPVRNLNGKPLTSQQKKLKGKAMMEGLLSDTTYDGCEKVWEYLCEFMENGPEGLDVPKRLYYPLSSKTTRTSISFREAVSYHWPFPPYRQNEPMTLQVIKTILVPVRLAFYIPNVLADGCWHWMMNWGKPKMLLPEQEKATQNAITPDMVFNILGKDKEFMPYLEAKEKLYGAISNKSGVLI